jgi:hypothetical protein
LGDESVIYHGNWQTSGGNKAILETLLDIRHLLAIQINLQCYLQCSQGIRDEDLKDVATCLTTGEEK